jgi:hypothetical protein
MSYSLQSGKSDGALLALIWCILSCTWKEVSQSHCPCCGIYVCFIISIRSAATEIFKGELFESEQLPRIVALETSMV